MTKYPSLKIIQLVMQNPNYFGFVPPTIKINKEVTFLLVVNFLVDKCLTSQLKTSKTNVF